jgi:hypothetical protein
MYLSLSVLYVKFLVPSDWRMERNGEGKWRRGERQ